ncbi:MAG: glycosyltransferase [Proteobacteria bacterium]|nr:glycosyltransferase [Pseudomonadota bacterium]
MIRVLICGSIDSEWRREAEIFLCRDREEYDRGLADGTLTPEPLRLPRVYPTFVPDEERVPWEMGRVMPQVIVSLGSTPKALVLINPQDQLKWYHFEGPPTPEVLKKTIYEVYLSQALFPNPGERDRPLVSVFTPTYNPGPYLTQAYRSLTAQTWRNWEWVVIDDGSTDETPRTLAAWAAHDSRIRFFRPVDRNYGNIGRMKRYASGLCLGEYLIELDHDDILTENALAEVVTAFQEEPELGFVYSNFAEFVEGGGDHYYPDWLDRGRYRRTEYQGRLYLEALAYEVYGDVVGIGPVIKDMTICPNHIRAFRAGELWRVGGYNPRLVMGDDFDLIIRMFCQSKIKHLDKLLYLYRIHANTWARFNEFARFFLPIVVQRWEPEIDRRIEALKKAGRWIETPQGRPGQSSEGIV